MVFYRNRVRYVVRSCVALIICCFLLLAAPQIAQAEDIELPRVVVVLYNKKTESELSFSRVHRAAAVVLNHLGLYCEFYDINEGLPDISHRADVRGVLTWLLGTELDDAVTYLQWASNVVDAGKRFVVMGDPAFFHNKKDEQTPLSAINRFLTKIGIKYTGEYVDITYDVNFTYKNPAMVGYERPLAVFRPRFQRMIPANSSVDSHLIAQKGNNFNTESHLVITSERGGYISYGYGLFTENIDGKPEIRNWIINPFLFFRLTFGTDELPKPDATTLAGRRMYYSHIDGDGWNNLSQFEEHRNKQVLAADVIKERAIKSYPDLPVTVAPIAADLDEKWVAREDSGRIAKELFVLPQVEAGSHTYSHPFAWEFFADGDGQKERPYLHQYAEGAWGDSKIGWVRKYLGVGDKYLEAKSAKISRIAGGYAYERPRAYAKELFLINMEVQGSANFISQFLPDNKRVEVYQWSGNTMPFERAVALVREANLVNINGGDTRFDSEFPSLAWVAPIGIPVGYERQIYASNSNENTYTNLWTGKFHGFKYLIDTVENTEMPIRLKPFNVYYHMYSGEKRASMDALIGNLNYARNSEIAPVTTSHYAKIANGFYAARLIKIEENRWRVLTRGKLQTIRFDNAMFKRVDFSKSYGVVGFRHHQGSLYVYLDEAIDDPVIKLVENTDYYQETCSNTTYLVHSRWMVRNLQRTKYNFEFNAYGYGDIDMHWCVAEDGFYEVFVNNNKIGDFASDGKHLYIQSNAIGDSRVSAVELVEVKIAFKGFE